ncbi:MAG: hypothetical protein WAK69_20540, partial [Rhodoplanes sp.]
STDLHHERADCSVETGDGPHRKAPDPRESTRIKRTEDHGDNINALRERHGGSSRENARMTDLHFQEQGSWLVQPITPKGEAWKFPMGRRNPARGIEEYTPGCAGVAADLPSNAAPNPC